VNRGINFNATRSEAGVEAVGKFEKDFSVFDGRLVSQFSILNILNSQFATMLDLDAAFHRLTASAFRRKFRLQGRELAYLQTWGLPHVAKQAADLIRQRLAPAEPGNDGRQTPWRNHPVFVAQHATATCCRGCLEKTHGIARGRALSRDEQDYVVSAIEKWLRQFLA
jgi:hypothetical protein